MSWTSHFILGRWRRCFSIISLMTVRLKSMLVMSWHAWSYLQQDALLCALCIPWCLLDEKQGHFNS